MPTIAVKIERFKSEIMNDVADRKRRIEAVADEKLSKDFNKKELEFLEEAYEIIQSGLKAIDREKSEVISKAQMENKVKLLAKRKEIIDTVFGSAKAELEKFAKTEEYKNNLIKKIHEHIKFLGSGEYIIYLNYKDKELYQEIQSEFKDSKVFFERKNIEMLGGCKLHNTTSNIYLDDSIAKRFEQEEENFLQECGIEINDKVGD